jgi:hypothetical protein
MTKVRIPEEPPVMTSTAASTADRQISETSPTISQQLSSNTMPNVRTDTKESNSNDPSTASIPHSVQAALTNITAAPETPTQCAIGSIQHDDSTALLMPGQSTIKIEEPRIKQEEQAPSPDVPIKNEKLVLSQVDLMPSEENQVPTNEVYITTTQNQDTATEEHVEASPTPAATGEHHSATDAEDDGLAKATNPTNREDQAMPPTAELMAAYKGLFRTYCGQTPAIDNKDINVALRQAEAIIKVAELYGSIPIVRPYLGNCLMQFDRDVYKAILRDPPRWLLLSLYLQSATIFKEAAVHIIGNLGHWPWSSVKLKDMPDDLVTFINKKTDRLKRLIADVERTLFTTSIDIKGEEAQLAPTDKRTINTWYVTQLWKQWFIRSVTQDEVPKPTGRTDGAKYRAIAKGIDAYLPLETVTDHIKAFRKPCPLTKVDKAVIEEDLKMIKTFAQTHVQELCVNNSMLSVEEAGIEHLTCAKVDDIDISWIKQGDSRIED